MKIKDKIFAFLLILSLSGCNFTTTYHTVLCKKESIVFIINNKPLTTELACDDEKRKTGLMNRNYLDPDSGMLFLFNKEDTQNFWMKDTFIPLSIAFIDKNWTIVDIQDMTPLDLTPVTSSQKSMYAIEVNQGWFTKNNVKIGHKILISEEKAP